MNFDELGLRAELLEAVRANGYDTPTPVQELAIPIVLQGRDLMAAAQTGTGKTAAFTLPLLHKLMETHGQALADHVGNSPQNSPQNNGRRDGRRAPKRRVRALVLVPTRELAAQVQESVKTYGGKLPLSSVVIFGGVGMQPQIDALRRGVDIVVATPGRLLDHAGNRNIDLSSVEFLVLDEGDRMLDMGFIHDIKRVLKMLPAKRQNLLFSATFADEIKALAEKLLDHPELVEVTPRNTAAETVEQGIYRVDRERKGDLLAELVHRGGWSQVLVFTRTKHGANRLAQKLERDGITAAAIHGNKSQNARTKALADFKGGGVRVLVATDIAARGLDIDSLPHVVNFELPFVAEDYVHRIGRTGRAGATGHAVSLVCVDENRLLQDIEKLLNRRFDALVLQGFEPDPNVAAEPLRSGRGGGGGRSGGGRSGGGRSGGGRPGGPRAGSGRPGGARSGGGRSGGQSGQSGQGSGGRRRSPAR